MKADERLQEKFGINQNSPKTISTVYDDIYNLLETGASVLLASNFH